MLTRFTVKITTIKVVMVEFASTGSYANGNLSSGEPMAVNNVSMQKSAKAYGVDTLTFGGMTYSRNRCSALPPNTSEVPSTPYPTF